MSSLIIPFGSATVVVPAGEALAVASQGSYQIWQQAVGSPNQPAVLSILNDVQAVAGNASQQTVTSTFTNGATLVVYATGNQPVAYEVGTAPIVKQDRRQPLTGLTAAAINTTATATVAQMLGGIITSSTAAAVTITSPTAAALDAATEVGIGESFEVFVINTGATNAITLAGGSGVTIVGATIGANGSSRWLFVKTAAGAFTAYRC